MPRRLLAPTRAAPCLALMGLTVWAGLAPIKVSTRDELFEIPAGTWRRRLAGDEVAILPSEIHLTHGANDVLLLRNLDSVPQLFGPVLIMPGQSFRLPFETVSSNDFVCTAHSSGTMRVVVDAMPAAGWPRLRWRIVRLWRQARRAFPT